MGHLPRSWQKLKSNIFTWLGYGLGVGLVGGLVLGMVLGLMGGPLSGVIGGLISGGVLGLTGGLIFSLIFEPNTGNDIEIVMETQIPNQGIRLSAHYAVLTGLLVAVIVGVSGWLIGGLTYGLILGLIGGLCGALIGGGDSVTKHAILRIGLRLQDCIPWNYARFLNYATALIFLRKVGGGYIFVHRLIMEHFAMLNEEDIERLISPLRK